MNCKVGVFCALCLCLLLLVETLGAASSAPELLFTPCSWQPVQCSWCPVLVLADSWLRCRVLPLRPRLIGASRCLTALLAAAVCSAISGDTWQPRHCVIAPPPKKQNSTDLQGRRERGSGRGLLPAHHPLELWTIASSPGSCARVLLVPLALWWMQRRPPSCLGAGLGTTCCTTSGLGAPGDQTSTCWKPMASRAASCCWTLRRPMTGW